MIDQAIDISGLSKAEVLAALYNATSPGGRGFLQAAVTPSEMTVEEAEQVLATQGTRFDWLNGRSFKVDLSGDTFEPWLYDRDNGGDGTAEKIIEYLRGTGLVVSENARNNRDNMTDQHAYESPVDAEVGEMVADAHFKWLEIVADGIDSPPEGATPREHLDWSSDQALQYFDRGEPDKAIILFLALLSDNPDNAWIVTHPGTPMLMQVGLMGGRHEMERMMKGFAA